MFGIDTALIVGLAVSAAGAALGSYMTYQGQRAQAEAAAAAERAQAQALEHDAKLREEAAQAELAKQRLEAQRRISSIRAAQGATGVAVGAGSSLLTELEAARLGEYEAQLAAFPYRQGAEQARYGAKIHRVQAGNVKRAGMYAARTAAIGQFAQSVSSSIATGMIR